MQKLNTTKFLKRPLALCLMFILLVATLSGCTPNPKNFSTTKITVTLDDSFEQYKSDTYELYVKSEDVGFSAREETSQELELAGYELISLVDYANEILSLNGSKDIKLQQRDDYYYFITTQTVNGAKYTYIHCMFEGNDAFWVCQFVFKSKDHKRLAEDVFSWADSIVITK